MFHVNLFSLINRLNTDIDYYLSHNIYSKTFISFSSIKQYEQIYCVDMSDENLWVKSIGDFAWIHTTEVQRRVQKVYSVFRLRLQPIWLSIWICPWLPLWLRQLLERLNILQLRETLIVFWGKCICISGSDTIHILDLRTEI